MKVTPIETALILSVLVLAVALIAVGAYAFRAIDRLETAVEDLQANQEEERN